MKTVNARKAQATAGMLVESVTIIIDEEFTTAQIPHDNFADYLAMAKHEHTANALVIADALVAALPGGTFDALLILLLDHKRNALSVPL